MIPEQLKDIERSLRKTVARRQFDDVTQQLGAMRLVADEFAASLPADGPERRELAAWSLAIIEWLRLAVCTQRQIWSGELTRLPHVGRYLDDPGIRLPDFHIDL